MKHNWSNCPNVTVPDISLINNFKSKLLSSISHMQVLLAKIFHLELYLAIPNYMQGFFPVRINPCIYARLILLRLPTVLV